ncbi:MAG: 16S rRNA (guanine(966)-N(2))-methyltransferase RsmD [Oscillospiraceae bacterium]|jgi:16S rRNA (guanine(966)-N(2))-methyltransferase RsmD|nr:16S rRNA (guanine(966)-N(2))-methyltransferase RsmD [Oscillospiraceae bacterium]
MTKRDIIKGLSNNMRVITGTARGTALATLPGKDLIRPTSQRVKEAMFSAIQFEIAGRRALDIFAGSGQLGIEALSRGAISCLFLEKEAAALRVLKQNLAKTRLEERGVLRQCEALQYLRRAPGCFGLIFLDPPYGQQLLQAALPLAADCLEPGGLILCEAPAWEAMPGQAGAAALEKTYRHGKTQVLLYRSAAQKQESL